MTILSSVLKESVKAFQKLKKRKHNFIDSLRIHVQGGAGGMGHPKYGGVGGRGGRVFVEAKEGMTLRDLKMSMKDNHKVKASTGQDSSTRCILGRSADDVVIQCPPGVVVMTEFNNKLGEVTQEGDMVMVAEEGAGGGPTTGYCGSKGQSLTIRLDLKLIADVAFVGFPNAGKSTLLSKLSRASPKIASYPFTTMRPTVGMTQYHDGRVISLADLPGLIEGAHVNCGLGHHFLRHVERSKMLLVVVDIGGFQLSHKYRYRSCIETILLLNREIELYKEPLLDKPAMLLINKMDTPNAEETSKEVVEAAMDLTRVLHKFPEEFRPERPFEFVSIHKISARDATYEELEECKRQIRRALDWAASEVETEAEKEAELLHKFRRKQTEFGPTLV
ncbi:GTP-binding protein 10-like [Macrosteles quadrilineatus]|uniref:GTP-binding protein 10-like n=1 Tax=Macrosteles quadrilineatus TaxID=74068 RepID=UPI0023E15257|nr:GTP-binding protein 10-like [Macrosteles quadrilineatus]